MGSYAPVPATKNPNRNKTRAEPPPATGADGEGGCGAEQQHGGDVQDHQEASGRARLVNRARMSASARCRSVRLTGIGAELVLEVGSQEVARLVVADDDGRAVALGVVGHECSPGVQSAVPAR